MEREQEGDTSEGGRLRGKGEAERTLRFGSLKQLHVEPQGSVHHRPPADPPTCLITEELHPHQFFSRIP